MKKKVMNIKPQEITENGERSVRYKGSDGKYHNIAAGSQQNTPSPQGQQSVAVGEVGGTSIILDEILPDRFYEVKTQMGSCILVTSMEDDQLAINIIGNSHDTMDYRVINSIWENEQQQWVISLDESATDISLTLLSEHDAIKAMVGNHQQLFEQFLNYDVLASLKRIENDMELGNVEYDTNNGAYIICAENQIDRYETLTLVAELNDNGWKSTVIKTFKLSNWKANVSGFEFMSKGGNLIMSVPASMTSFTVFRLSGILGTVVDFLKEPKFDVVQETGTVYANELKNGQKIMVLDGEVTALRLIKTLNDDWMFNVDLSSSDAYKKGPNLIEYLETEDSTVNGGFRCYAIINGKPMAITPFYNGGPDPSQGF